MPECSFKQLGIMLICTLLAAATGCKSPPDKLVFDNYSLIRQAASTRTEVTSLLGEPNHELGSTWLYNRVGKHLTVIIEFDSEGRVEHKQWIDADQEVWNDSAD